MSLFDALVLGLVQGLTEFLPVSSSAHLIFTARGLSLKYTPAELTAIMAVIQLGTLAAVFAYFARDLAGITRALFRPRAPESRDSLKLLGLMVIGTIPIVVVGLLLKKHIEGPWTKDLRVIAASLIFWSIVLAAAERLGARRRAMADARTSDAWIIGAFQVFALVPGASRSGTTLSGGLFAGLTRETAARLSFLLSIPAIAASGLLELKEALGFFNRDTLAPLAAGTVVAGLSGYAAIWFLIRFLRTRSTAVFIVYRVALGILLFVLLFAGKISPR